MLVSVSASPNERRSTVPVLSASGTNGGGTSPNDPNAASALTVYLGPIRSGKRFVSPGIATISYAPSKPRFVSSSIGSTRIFAGPFDITTSAQ